MDEITIILNGSIVIVHEDVSYKSTVQDILEDSILINVPIGNGKHYDFKQDKEIEMNYYADDNYYIFKSKLINRQIDKETRIPLYRISEPYEIRKIQRREFVRVDMVDYIYIKDINNDNEAWKRAMLLNISGGGIRFSINHEFLKHQIISIKIVLDGQLYILKGRIVRSCEKSKDGVFVYGVEFVDIKEAIREKIIQKVFKILSRHKKSI